MKFDSVGLYMIGIVGFVKTKYPLQYDIQATSFYIIFIVNQKVYHTWALSFIQQKRGSSVFTDIKVLYGKTFYLFSI